jgi:cytochrome b subunit of formate dehydrogenase
MFTIDDNEFEPKKSATKETPVKEKPSLFEGSSAASTEAEEQDFSDLGIDEHEEYIIRMSKNERIQHVFLFVSVTLLVITGFALKIPIDYITKLGQLGSTLFKIRGYVHRIFGAILMILTAYHFINMAISKEGKLYFKRMIPRIKDVTDGIHNISFMMGFSKEAPKMEWFDYKEKIEYWALQAGTMLIGGTGIILWSHTMWPQLIVNLSYLIHGMEAILATGAIIIWHFYYIHFKPGQFPMNRTWIDGKMSLAHLKHEHRLVYDRYMAERAKEIRNK